MMSLDDRLDALGYLRTYLVEPDERLEAAVKYAAMKNVWFTEDTINHRLRTIRDLYLDDAALRSWLNQYSVLDKQTQQQAVGIVAAANIPLVVIHDVLCVFLSGHTSLVKLSDRDKYLLPFLIEVIAERYPSIQQEIVFVERLKDYDAVIATGSTNTSRYFHQYFGQVPHIIRANRTGIGILTGNESDEELDNLSLDIVQYFGLGCRNISMLLVPKHYNFDRLLESLHKRKDLVRHSPFKNNYDYNKSLHILNGQDHLSTGSIMLIEQEKPSGQPSVCAFRHYSSETEILEILKSNAAQIQLIAGQHPSATTQFGESQFPKLMDYADGVDTMEFLVQL